MLNELNNIVTFLNNYIWGIGMLVLVVGSGLYFTIRLHGFQFVHFKDMWSRIIDKQDSDSGISAFGSFCTTMAMRVGTGNVAGVAVAIYMGGPGALFWMILAGMTNSAVCFGMYLVSSLQDKNRWTVSRRRRLLRRERTRMEEIWCIYGSDPYDRNFRIYAGSRYIYNL